MDVRLPPLGEGADSGTVVNIFVKEGDRVAKDQPLLELENEKAVATIPSSGAGVVTKVFVQVGEKINVGQRLLSLKADDKAAPASAAPARPAPAPARDEHEEAPAEEEVEPADATEEPQGPPPAASPAIRKLAKDLGINLAKVRGTARGGRITLKDLRAYIERLQRIAEERSAGKAPTARPAPEPIDFEKWGPVTRKPLSPLREVISRRMTENWNTIPHVTQFDEADITGLLVLRKKRLAEFEKKGVRLTVTTLILKAVVKALKQHPIFNASLDEATQQVVLKNHYHFGIAVDTEAGLIVPVLRDVDKKDLVQLSKDLEDLAARARDRKVTGEELKGGTFTISNQGGIGGGHFTPIINKPEVAILGLGKAAMKAVVRGSAIEPRMMLPLAVSYDHRLIDGANAARFTVDLVKAIEGFDEKDMA
ncbi:MAG TPA: biotin/lipoyl-binding protein [Verrucomicrobia bacterium]|nr:biotin/lipoyl-binding protein [Verrucomicrobiota bacterium]HOB33027.1 2-oxo acid dehydrogenase subunit E2 [Verrucomicrobiota bacterium]HOP98811.1 2-oxo acid dehydrogenase subunit E2 [Verrucomicrobiota bacterium]HPU55705.1 2-oxo acid dehydrogenase subunit E2 [Verrucomicrobiota bacterium]